MRPASVFLMKQAPLRAPNETANDRRREVTIPEGEKRSRRTRSADLGKKESPKGTTTIEIAGRAGLERGGPVEFRQPTTFRLRRTDGHSREGSWLVRSYLDCRDSLLTRRPIPPDDHEIALSCVASDYAHFRFKANKNQT
jgi:hypothetical protein